MPCSTTHLEVSLLGGFGNQLFQFANAVSLSLQESRVFTFKVPGVGRPYALDALNIYPGRFYRVSMNTGELEIIETDSNCKALLKFSFREKQFGYHPVNLKKHCCSISGYFQSYRYFESIDAPLRKWLIKELNLVIKTESIEKIGLHARFGDMARERKFRDYHGVIAEDYVTSALGFFQSSVNDLHIVSENVEDFQREMPNIFKYNPTFLSGKSALDDFKRLVGFKRLIISNSTFSWWSAWCSEASTVAPKNWFSPKVLAINPIDDLIPEHWTLI
jgi:hypothetical protein